MPIFAKVIARFVTVVVLPSPGPGLVTSIVLVGLSTVAKVILVRKLRYASDIGDLGSSFVIIRRFISFETFIRPLCPFVILFVLFFLFVFVFFVVLLISVIIPNMLILNFSILLIYFI